MRIFLAHPLLLVAILAQCSSGFDYTKEHAAMQCCGKISNADFQACSYKALEQDLSEMIEWFHADSIDPANLNQTMKAKVTKDIEEMVKEDTDFLIQMEKCTTQGKDQTLCCLERGVCTKCAAVVCNGTLNMENYEKRDVAVSMQQFLDAIAFCDGQVANYSGGNVNVEWNSDVGWTVVDPGTKAREAGLMTGGKCDQFLNKTPETGPRSQAPFIPQHKETFTRWIQPYGYSMSRTYGPPCTAQQAI